MNSSFVGNVDRCINLNMHTHICTHIKYIHTNIHIYIIHEINYISIMLQVFTFMWGKWYNYGKIVKLVLLIKIIENTMVSSLRIFMVFCIHFYGFLW